MNLSRPAQTRRVARHRHRAAPGAARRWRLRRRMAKRATKPASRALRRWASSPAGPLLGICLGMQLLGYARSVEGGVSTPGWARGRVVGIQPANPGCGCLMSVGTRRSINRAPHPRARHATTSISISSTAIGSPRRSGRCLSRLRVRRSLQRGRRPGQRRRERSSILRRARRNGTANPRNFLCSGAGPMLKRRSIPAAMLASISGAS